MNDKPTSTEMVFGGFLLVFGIIAGIGIREQMIPKPPKVTYEYGNGWKTGGTTERVEGVWFTNRVPDTLVSNIYITDNPWLTKSNTVRELCVIRSYEKLVENGGRQFIVERSISGAAFQEIFRTGFDVPATNTNIVIQVTNPGSFKIKIGADEKHFPSNDP